MLVQEFLEPGFKTIEQIGGYKSSESPPTHNLPAKLLIIDLEMSGPNPREHEVLDIGGVLASMEEGFPELTSWGSKVRPLHIGTGDIGALATVSYSSKKWKDSMSLEKAITNISQIGHQSIITGWGISQDLAFLNETYHRLNQEWPFLKVAIDVQNIAKKMLTRSEIDRLNLGHVADRLGIGRLGEHSALADAYTTYDVLTTLWKRVTK